MLPGEADSGAGALDSLVESAFEYAYPLHAMASTRHRAVQAPGRPNQLRHERHLSDHRSRWITAPNNDTLYSNAWLDLSAGPVRVQADEMPAGRYWSLAFLDAFTNHFAIVGQRREGPGPVNLSVLGPGQADPVDGSRVIRAPGQDAWLFVRCLVDGPGDLPMAHAMQDRIRVQPAPGSLAPDCIEPGPSTDAENFLAVANQWLARNPPPAAEASLLARWAVVGLRPGAIDAWWQIGDEARAAWQRRIAPAHQNLRRASATGRREVQGWFASAPEMGDFGGRHALRASVALGGLGALPPSEAMYFVRFHDDAKDLLDGRHHYTLRVPPRGIPTDSFWSLSMYEPTADAQRFFVENPIQRYSIGNRTPGLVYNADGSLDIALQHAAPADERLRANWLPAPAGPFQISLRAYLPRAELREARVALPTIVRG